MYLRSHVAVFDRLSSNLVEPFLSAIPWTRSLAKRSQEYMAFQNAMCISCTSNTEIILSCQDGYVPICSQVRFLFYRYAMEELNHNVLQLVKYS